MRTFFSRIFVKEESLEREGIYYAIKLEYYKITNEEKNQDSTKEKYGIDIVKTEYRKEGVKKENEAVEHISNNESKIDEILKTLERNEVTPIELKEIIIDILK